MPRVRNDLAVAGLSRTEEGHSDAKGNFGGTDNPRDRDNSARFDQHFLVFYYHLALFARQHEVRMNQRGHAERGEQNSKHGVNRNSHLADRGLSGTLAHSGRSAPSSEHHFLLESLSAALVGAEFRLDNPGDWCRARDVDTRRRRGNRSSRFETARRWRRANESALLRLSQHQSPRSGPPL